MKLKTYFALLLTILIFSGQAVGQGVDDKVKNRTEDEADERVDKKINKGVEKGFDAIEGLFKKKNKKKNKRSNKADTRQSDQEPSKAQQNAMMKMFGGEADVADSYDFDIRLVSETTTSKKGKRESRSKYAMLFKPGADYMGMQPLEVENQGERYDTETNQSQIIFDMGRKVMVTLIDNKEQGKTGVAINFDPEQIEEMTVDQEKEAMSDEDYNFSKTGNTKDILGYSCDEYEYSGEDGSGTFWITDELDASMTEMFAAMGQNSKKRNSSPFGSLENYPEGTVMEMHGENTEDNTQIDMKVTEVDESANATISTTDYQIMSMGNMGQSK